MSGIWIKAKNGWSTAPSQRFKLENELHSLVKDNIQMLPLAGSPRLSVIGSEIRLGSGWVDLLAVEMSGRPVIIEVKLARNAEAKRAIVAQALAYAASLRGWQVGDLEEGPLQGYLKSQGHQSILEAVQAQDQYSAVDAETFAETMQQYLATGAFRLVLLLDETSAELERLIAYLDAVTRSTITIDLITVSRYKVGGMEVALPQRVSPETDVTSTTTRPTPSQGELSDGPEVFRASIKNVMEGDQRVFESLLDWATEVEDLPDVALSSYRGVRSERFTLLLRFISQKAGLVTIWNDKGKPYIQFWRSVFEKRAPKSIDSVEQIIEKKLGQGNTVTHITPELLKALTGAYREATET